MGFIEKARSTVLIISLLVIGGGFLTWFILISSSGDALKDKITGTLPEVDFSQLAPQKDGYLACVPQQCPEGASNIDSKVYDVSRAKLSQALFNFTDYDPTIKEYRRNFSHWRFDFTVKQPGEKFPHVVTIQLVSLGDERSGLNFYSRSELKSSDQEIHKKRYQKWFNYIEANLNQ